MVTKGGEREPSRSDQENATKYQRIAMGLDPIEPPFRIDRGVLTLIVTAQEFDQALKTQEGTPATIDELRGAVGMPGRRRASKEVFPLVTRKLQPRRSSPRREPR